MAAERFEKAPEAPHRSGSEVSSRQAGIGESGRPGTSSRPFKRRGVGCLCSTRGTTSRLRISAMPEGYGIRGSGLVLEPSAYKYFPVACVE